MLVTVQLPPFTQGFDEHGSLSFYMSKFSELFKITRQLRHTKRSDRQTDIRLTGLYKVISGL